MSVINYTKNGKNHYLWSENRIFLLNFVINLEFHEKRSNNI